jgi:hypothetical protein
VKKRFEKFLKSASGRQLWTVIDERKPSYKVAEYLKEHGYKIVPINPTIQEVLG